MLYKFATLSLLMFAAPLGAQTTVNPAAPTIIQPTQNVAVVSQQTAADVLRTGAQPAAKEYLERHFHSDRFYIDGNRLWLELPNRLEQEPDQALLVWYEIPKAITVARPAAGSRAGAHAIPKGWDMTLCAIPTGAWTSGIRTEPEAEVDCRLCWVRLIAAELVRGVPVEIATAR